jgi:adhesin transport system membrane fusion protein
MMDTSNFSGRILAAWRLATGAGQTQGSAVHAADEGRWLIHEAREREEPLRARWLLRFALISIIALIAWAALAHVEEVTRGEGKVIPSRQLQVVQSVDGGVISEILVREGQVVSPGEIVMRIDNTRFVSSAREGHSQFLAVQVKAARLKAVSEGTAFSPSEEAMKEVPEVVKQENELYLSKRAEIDAQLGIAQQQLGQRSQEIAEAVARRDQAGRSMDLVSRELALTKPLVQSGAVSEVEVLRLEREVARLRGDREQALAQIARSEGAVREASRKIQEVRLTVQNQQRAELSDANAKLNSLTEGNVGLQDKVKYAELRSPVRGTIKRLLVNTVGGVVQPGKELVEIVPLDDALLLEARVAPKDIAFLRPSQKAIVKFNAYDFAIYGGLEGVLEHISADTVADEHGNPFYIVRVRTLKPDFGTKNPIVVGMVAEVDILTGNKSVLSYLVKPVLRAKAYALTER